MSAELRSELCSFLLIVLTALAGMNVNYHLNCFLPSNIKLLKDIMKYAFCYVIYMLEYIMLKK